MHSYDVSGIVMMRIVYSVQRKLKTTQISTMIRLANAHLLKGSCIHDCVFTYMYRLGLYGGFFSGGGGGGKVHHTSIKATRGETQPGVGNHSSLPLCIQP